MVWTRHVSRIQVELTKFNAFVVLLLSQQPTISLAELLFGKMVHGQFVAVCSL